MIRSLQLLELKALHLKGVDGDDANPGECTILQETVETTYIICNYLVAVCKHPTYMNVIMRTLPHLQTIDGVCDILQRQIRC